MTLTILNTNAVLTMTSREIADLTSKRHDNVMTVCRALKDACVCPEIQETTYTNEQNGQQYSQFVLSKRDSFVLVARLSPEYTARIVDRWQELESKQSAPIELSRLDILTLAIESEKGRLLAVEQRDHAIATKAQIGNKREATAMATASKAVKEVARLKDQLGFSVRQATIMQVEDATGRDYDFLPLRRWCVANEVVAESVPDKRYPNGVKAWPAGAWSACYGVSLTSLFGEVTA